MMTLTAISQKDILSDSLVCLPKGTMKEIILDLESGDQARRELALTYSINIDLNNTIALKNSVILDYRKKEATYIDDINSYKQIIDAKNAQIEIVKAEAKKYRRQRNGVIVGGSALIIAIPTLILVYTL
jgi:hypothetical protein